MVAGDDRARLTPGRAQRPGYCGAVKSTGHRVDVRLQPRASRNEIAGHRAGRLLVRVTAPPVDDKANVALCRLIAKRAGVSRSEVRIVVGAHSRDKVVEISGLERPPAWAEPGTG